MKNKYYLIILLLLVMFLKKGFSTSPSACNLNEQFKGQATCDISCTTLNQPCNPDDPVLQPFDCICALDFARNDTGICIPIEQCPEFELQDVCSETEVYLQQGRAPNCDAKCATFGQECTIVHAKAPFGCYCKQGYARNQSGICIQASVCPITCGPNEIFYHQEPVPQCDLRCENYRKPCNINFFEEKFRCYCQLGFARDINDICIPIECCPTPECGINEEWVLYLPYCEPSCTNIGQPCTIDFIMAPGPGCTCQKGYVRNNVGICIPQRQCPNQCEQTCGKNEVWLLQGEAPYCETRCDTLGMLCEINYIWPPGPGCYCKDGYARNKCDECVPVKCCFRSNLLGF